MAVVFVNNPVTSAPRMAREPLVFTVETNTGGWVPSRDRIWVEVAETTNDSNYAVRSKIYMRLNNANVCHFDLSDTTETLLQGDYLQDDGENVIHTTGVGATDPITMSRNGVRKYRIQFGEYFNGTENAYSQQVYQTIMNGARQIREGLMPSTTDIYIGSGRQKLWLTKRYADSAGAGSTVEWTLPTTATACASWYQASPVNISNVQITIDLKNGSTLTHDLTIGTEGGQAFNNSNVKGRIHTLGVGPANLDGYMPAGKRPNTDSLNWLKISFYLYSTSGSPTVRSHVLRILPDRSNSKNQRVQVGFENSLGGWDYLMFNGRSVKTVQRVAKTMRQNLGAWNQGDAFELSKYSRETKFADLHGKDSYTLNAFDMTYEDYQMLQELMRSRSVWMRMGCAPDDDYPDLDVWMPIVIDQTSAEVRQNEVLRTWSVDLQVSLDQRIRC